MATGASRLDRAPLKRTEYPMAATNKTHKHRCTQRDIHTHTKMNTHTHTHTHTHIPWLTGPSCCGRPHGCLVRCHCARTDLLDGCDTIHFVVIVIADVVVVLSCSPCLSPATPTHVLTYVSFFCRRLLSVGFVSFTRSSLTCLDRLAAPCCVLVARANRSTQTRWSVIVSKADGNTHAWESVGIAVTIAPCTAV